MAYRNLRAAAGTAAREALARHIASAKALLRELCAAEQSAGSGRSWS